jgi:hypothetical protein
MVDTIDASAFLKVLSTGRTCPYLMICTDSQDNQIETVVKLIAGNECSSTSLICELIASLLAIDLGLPIPQPYLVKIGSDLCVETLDRNLVQRFQQCIGMNFGSIHLGQGFITWPTGRNVPTSLLQISADIFAFDILIQNPDRRIDKPNLLRKGDDIVIFDHEMAFSFIYSLFPDEFPWNGNGMNFAPQHVFYNSLKGHPISFDRMQEAFESIENQRFEEYLNTVPSDWRRSGKDFALQIKEYLVKARDNSPMLFQKIKELLI